MKTTERPELSIVIVMVSDAAHLLGCLQALSQQIDPPVMEILVPYDGADSDLLALQASFSAVQFCPLDLMKSAVHPRGITHANLDKLRARGIQTAKGPIIALLEDHGRADRHWARRIVEAHREPHAAVGGAIENEIDRPLNWAIYFSDFIRYQKPLKAGQSFFLSDTNIAYKRESLESIRPVWQESFHETSVNGALLSKGEILWLSPDIVVYQNRENLNLRKALRERYLWGRAYAGTRAREVDSTKRWLFCILSPALPPLLMARKAHAIIQKRRLVREFLRSLPLIALLTLFWAAGEFMGYFTARPEAE